MFCSRKALHRLDNMHGRSLRLKHQNYATNFIILLVNANEKTIQQKCLEFLMIEIYKYLNDASPQIMNYICRLRKIT